LYPAFGFIVHLYKAIFIPATMMKASLSLLLLAACTLTTLVNSSQNNNTDNLCISEGLTIQNNTRILAANEALATANQAEMTKCFTGTANTCIINVSSQLAQFESVCLSQNAAIDELPVTWKCADNSSSLTFSVTYATCHGLNCSSSIVAGAWTYTLRNVSDTLNAALQPTGIVCNYTEDNSKAATSSASRMVSWAATALVALTTSVLVML
jgi:hypothetical protein